MIWFACKQCGKRHGRSEALAGTLIFCECGCGNRVPWSSTVAEPEPEEAAPAPRTEDRPPKSDRERSGWPRRSRERRRPNPAFCLNHEETPKDAVCAACRCSFCSACVVEFQGQTLCGPCKNFHLAGLSRPAQISPLAVVAFVLALIGTLVGLVLSIVAFALALAMQSVFAAVACCTVALVAAIGEMILSAASLRLIDRQPGLGGRGLAMTGAMAGLSGVVWSVSLAAFIVFRQIQG